MLGHDVNHPPPPRADVKNDWKCTFTAPKYLHGVNRDDFTCHS